MTHAEYCGSAEDKMHSQKMDYCLGICCHQTTEVVLGLGDSVHRINSTSAGDKIAWHGQMFREQGCT